MRKLCFIIPYFGTLPNYFQLFLNSCARNPGYNWLLLTDDMRAFDYPENVNRVEMTFAECRGLVEKKLGFETTLRYPYKLCDVKPMYGYVFQDFISDFEYWGYCDVDMLVGNLSRFLTDDFLAAYDKVFCLGHMTIYRNTPENNKVFMRDYNGCVLYKEVMTQAKTMTFDEEWRDDRNINQLFKSHGKRVFEEDWSLNFSISHNEFRKTTRVGWDKAPKTHGYIVEDYVPSVYTWEDGNVCCYRKEGGKIQRKEYPYIHLQWRNMRIGEGVEALKTFKIVPDEFLPLEVETVTLENFDAIKKMGFCDLEKRARKKRWNYRINKLKKLLGISK